MDARDQILSNIQKAKTANRTDITAPLFQHRSREELLRRWEEIHRYSSSHTDELVDSFKKECESVLGRVYVAKNKDEVWQYLSLILEEAKIKKIVKWDSPVLDRLEIDSLLVSVGVQDLLTEETDPDKALERGAYFEIVNEAELGISGADYGLADTGTLVSCAFRGQERSTSLLPPNHVAIMEAERILPSSDDLIVKLQLDMAGNGTLDSCLSLITGPSKTADIELNLILGVHGPKNLYVIILKST